MVATCKWEGCKNEIKRWGPSPRMKLWGSGSNIRLLWLKLGGDGNGCGYGKVGGMWGTPDWQLVHWDRVPSVVGGWGGLNK